MHQFLPSSQGLQPLPRYKQKHWYNIFSGLTSTITNPSKLIDARMYLRSTATQSSGAAWLSILTSLSPWTGKPSVSRCSRGPLQYDHYSSKMTLKTCSILRIYCDTPSQRIAQWPFCHISLIFTKIFHYNINYHVWYSIFVNEGYNVRFFLYIHVLTGGPLSPREPDSPTWPWLPCTWRVKMQSPFSIWH